MLLQLFLLSRSLSSRYRFMVTAFIIGLYIFDRIFDHKLIHNNIYGCYSVIDPNQ